MFFWKHRKIKRKHQKIHQKMVDGCEHHLRSNIFNIDRKSRFPLLRSLAPIE